jgi:hypothetical protein
MDQDAGPGTSRARGRGTLAVAAAIAGATLVAVALVGGERGGGPSSIRPGALRPLRAMWRGRAPERSVAYRIEARLVEERRSVEGRVALELRNTSHAPISELRFHLYLNAFAGPDTIFMRGTRGQLRFSRADPDSPGGISIRSARSAGRALARRLLFDGTVLAVELERPVPAGGTVAVELEFESRLPRVFARTGFAGDFYLVAQFYPRLGVLRDDGSWDCPPQHATAEFFGPFGTFEVTLALPERFVVGSTGVLVAREARRGEQVLRLRAEEVHDFVIAAWPHFVERVGRAGGVVVRHLSVPGRTGAARDLALVRIGLGRLEEWLGPYPYSLLTVVDVPSDALGAGAMEYPTLFTSWRPFFAAGGVRAFDEIVIHELCHQYFQGILGSNEVEEPWLDEGIATYVAGLLLDEIHGPSRSAIDLGPVRVGSLEEARLKDASPEAPLPVGLRAPAFTSWSAYGRTVYARAALLLRTVDTLVGHARVVRALGVYARRHALGHPTGRDLVAALLDEAPADRRTLLASLFGAVVERGEAMDVAISCGEGRVEVQRRGAVVLPLEIEIRDGRGRTRRVAWDGRVRRLELPAPDLASASLGPAGLLLLDRTPLDNSCTAAGGGPSTIASIYPLAAVLQVLLQLVGA